MREFKNEQYSCCVMEKQTLGGLFVTSKCIDSYVTLQFVNVKDIDKPDNRYTRAFGTIIQITSSYFICEEYFDKLWERSIENSDIRYMNIDFDYHVLLDIEKLGLDFSRNLVDDILKRKDEENKFIRSTSYNYRGEHLGDFVKQKLD